MKTFEEFKANPSEVTKFHDPATFYDFKIDKKACERLNNILGTTFVSVYRIAYLDKIKGKDENTFDISCEYLYCVRQDGKIVLFTNSEWGDVSIV